MKSDEYTFAPKNFRTGSAVGSSTLFRAEAIKYAYRLEGDVVITRAPSLTLITLLLAFIGCVLVTWVAVGRYARTEHVIGQVVTAGALSKVYAERPGRILWLGVKEGDYVRAGQALARVRVEQPLSDGSLPSDAHAASLGQQADAIRRQIVNEDARAAAEQVRLARLIKDLDEEKAQLGTQIEFQKAAVESTKRSFEVLGALGAKGFVSQTEQERRRQAWLGAAAQYQATVQQMSQLSERRGTAQAELSKLPGDHSTRDAEFRRSLADLDGRRIDAESARGFVITAPVGGRVTALQAVAGRTSDGRLPLLAIVPLDSRMEVTLFAPSRAIGLARVGQSVRLRYDAFPYQRFGTFSGRIIAISRSALAPEEVDSALKFGEPVYTLRVRLDQQRISAFGQDMPLEPGMTLQADIALDRRSFLDWLLEPIRAVQSRA
ncbi:HlyD family secretion protein [Sphingomonas sp. TDK1]|uniref:HlyD family secretion protein n=1 Tax=Sphingomonas sp. TDK1 TaxID=453247 RepID=UPI0018DCFFC3|nr:HlyD family efflux transporter periplasmic adaptor subunit [Sphingomonas sp. TDK1]